MYSWVGTLTCNLKARQWNYNAKKILPKYYPDFSFSNVGGRTFEVTVVHKLKRTKEMCSWGNFNSLRPFTKTNSIQQRWEKRPSGGLDKVLPAALFYCQLNRAILETKLLKHTQLPAYFSVTFVPRVKILQWPYFNTQTDFLLKRKKRLNWLSQYQLCFRTGCLMAAP